MKYIIIDLEMNPLSKEFREERRICRNEIIQIGAVALDENYQEVGSFKTFVKPQFNEMITSFLYNTNIGSSQRKKVDKKDTSE